MRQYVMSGDICPQRRRNDFNLGEAQIFFQRMRMMRGEIKNKKNLVLIGGLLIIYF
jgi:hypothetical protein